MIANNIFRAIGDFCTTVLFQPFDSLRSLDNWWVQNIVSWVLASIAFMGLLYWLGQLKKFQKTGNE